MNCRTVKESDSFTEQLAHDYLMANVQSATHYRFNIEVRCVEWRFAMTINAIVVLEKNEFVAELSDGRQFRQSGVREMAAVLHGAGVFARDARYEWHPGHRMLTAGQQVALTAEMRRLESLRPGLSLAA